MVLTLNQDFLKILGEIFVFDWDFQSKGVIKKFNGDGKVSEPRLPAKGITFKIDFKKTQGRTM